MIKEDPVKGFSERYIGKKSIFIPNNAVKEQIPASTTFRTPAIISVEGMYELAKNLRDFEEKDPQTPVKIYIATFGGSVHGVIEAGLQIRNYSKRLNIETIATSDCESAGVFLLASGKPGKRSAWQHTNFMFHRPSFDIEKANLQIPEIEENLRQYRLMETRFTEIFSQFTGMPVEQITEEFYQRDTFFTAQDALRYGIIDKVIPNADS